MHDSTIAIPSYQAAHNSRPCSSALNTTEPPNHQHQPGQSSSTSQIPITQTSITCKDPVPRFQTDQQERKERPRRTRAERRTKMGKRKEKKMPPVLFQSEPVLEISSCCRRNRHRRHDLRSQTKSSSVAVDSQSPTLISPAQHHRFCPHHRRRIPAAKPRRRLHHHGAAISPRVSSHSPPPCLHKAAALQQLRCPFNAAQALKIAPLPSPPWQRSNLPQGRTNSLSCRSCCCRIHAGHCKEKRKENDQKEEEKGLSRSWPGKKNEEK